MDALMLLFDAIAARDSAKAKRLLAKTPELVLAAAKKGATRRDSVPHFYKEILHYVYEGDTALHLAAAAYEVDVVRMLIAKRANVRAKNRRGAEPLHYAADGAPNSAHWNPQAQHDVVGLLVEAGADPNVADKSGICPLHRAVRTRSAAAVEALLEGGADARRENPSGSTPLHLAVQTTGRGGSGSTLAREQQVRIIHLLLDHGARASDKDGRGKKAKDCATGWAKELLSARPKP